MELPETIEWLLHACLLLAALPEGKALPAAKLAEYHDLPAAYLAKNLQALASAGIVETTVGRTGGYRLAKPPQRITLLEVIDAVGAGPRFQCKEIRQQGPCAGPPGAYRRACGIARAMYRADAAWRAELSKHTVADLISGMVQDVAPERRSIYRDWIGAACR